MVHASLAYRPVEYQPTARRACAAQRGLSVVVLWRNARRAPRQAAGWGSTALSPRQVGSTGLCRSRPPRFNPMAHAPLAYRPVEYLPTALGAHRAVWTWRGCVVAERGALSLPSRRLGLDCTNTTAVWRHGLSKFVTTAFDSHSARLARSPPRGVSADRQRSTRRAVRAWRGCVVAQREARSSPSHRLGLDCIITATGRQHGSV